jgi:hypothetical protein
MKINLIPPQSPVAQTRANISGSADMYGACSIEKFSSASPLGLTHEDAAGWIDYVTRWTPGNFWYGDGAVKVWMYEEAYDNWQDTYGADAVVAFYHSGHGNMDSNGVFQCPMGGAWDGRDWAFSNRMSLGDEQVKYLFWSTCLSLRVLGGHSPIRTWHPVNKGLRMIFGYETVSVDNPNYGKFFWEEWNKGKTFAQAFLDASWRISTGQAPSVCACGANAADALNRLNTERYFYSNGGWNNWYQWRWYYARAAATPARLENLPANMKVAEFAPVNHQDAAARMADTLGIGSSKEAGMDVKGNLVFEKNGATLHVHPNGHFDATLESINFANNKQIDEKKAQGIAEKLISKHGLDKIGDVELANVRHGYTQGGSPSGSIDTAHITDTTFEYRQKINGLQVITPDAGVVRITVDNDGKVTHLHSSLREVTKMSEKPKVSAKMPPDPSDPRTRAGEAALTEAALDNAFNALLEGLVNKTGANVRSAAKSAELVSSQIGYDATANHGGIVAHREYELSFGNDLKKRYQLQVPIFQ